MKNNYSFFRNIDCEYFPCHKVKDTENFNCLFCFCPLFLLENCGGHYTYTKEGIKDCTNCIIPHRPDNYMYIVDKLYKK